MSNDQEAHWQIAYYALHAEQRQGMQQGMQQMAEEAIAAMNAETVGDYMLSMLDYRRLYGSNDTLAYQHAVEFARREGHK
jgi:hypothetical protein